MNTETKAKIKTKLDNSQIVRQLFFNVIFIIILSNLVGALTNFTDGICASRLVNDAASAALAVISPLITFVSIINNIIQIGTQIYASKKLAQGDIDGAKKAFSTSITMCVVSGIILGVVMISICSFSNVLFNLGADSASYKYAFWYVIGFFCGVPFYIAYTVLLPLANLVNGKKLSTISIIAVLVVNVIGDVVSGALFKYGPHSGDLDFGKWAMLGIAIATSMSYVAGVIVLSFVFISKKSVLKFSFKSISPTAVKEIILIGLPAGAKVVFIFLRSSTINILFTNAYAWAHPILRYDSRVLFTALSAQSHLTPFVESVTGGLIATSLSLSSIFYAEEDEESLNELLKLVIQSSFIVVLILAVIYAMLAPALVTLYGVGETTEEDPELAACMIEQSQWAIVWDALATPFVALNASFLAFFQGTRRTKYAYIVTCLQSLVLPLASVALFIFCFNFNGDVWLGISMGFVFYTSIHLIYSFIYAKVHKNKFRINARTLFFLPKDFGYTEDQCLRVVIKGIVDVNTLPDKIIEFCGKQGIDKKRTYSVSACAEELSRSIVLSGFPRGKRKRQHVCELRILYKKTKKKNDIILRIRDDCALYDLQERARRVYIKDDPISNVALRIVYHNAKDVKYSNLLKTNNLVITI